MSFSVTFTFKCKGKWSQSVPFVEPLYCFITFGLKHTKVAAITAWVNVYCLFLTWSLIMKYKTSFNVQIIPINRSFVATACGVRSYLLIVYVLTKYFWQHFI